MNSQKLIKPAKEKEANGSVRSISRAADILRCLMNEIDSIKDIAACCGQSKATVHRILGTLEKSDLVFMDPISHKYYLGPFINQLSSIGYNSHKNLIAQSLDEVNRIWDLFGEFTALDVEQGLQTKAIIEIQSRFSYSVTKRTAGRYYGSAAKVLMGQHSVDEIDVILENIKPVPTSKNCVTDKVKLKAQFKKARRQGYYMSRKEIHEGIMGISVPIKNYVYPVVLSIVGPEDRLLPLASNAIQEMIKSADIISAKIANRNK